VSAAALVAVAVIVAGAATVQLSTGFGFALAAVPLLAVVLDARTAVVTTLCLATTTNLWQAWSQRSSCDRVVAARMVAGAAIGLPAGFALFVLADVRVLELLIGVAVLGAVVSIVRGVDLRQASARLDVVGGVCAGALTTSVGTNGPPLVFVLQARHFDPPRFRATITTVFFVLDVISVAVFAVTGRLDGDVAGAFAAAVPGLLVGAAVGSVLRHRLDPVRFRRAVLALLVVAAITALVSAGTG